MWIERIDVAGFGKLTGEKIEFKPNKLNLLVEPNDYGKSTIAEAVWAILFDFARHQGAGSERAGLREFYAPPRSLNLPYIASIDVTSLNRALKIIRDFEDGSLQVVDRNTDHQDVTGEFLTPEGEDQVGLKITGISRELFLNTFYVGQRQLSGQIFGQLDLASIFQSIADSSTPASTAGAAVSLIDDTLSHFPYNGSSEKVDQLIKSLEMRRDELAVRARSLEQQRESVVGEFSQLNQVDERILDDSHQVRATEYFELCLSAAELDNRLIKVQKRLGKLQQVRSEVQKLEGCSTFPFDAAKEAEELWMKRQSRLDDQRRIKAEVDPRQSVYEQTQAAIKAKYGGLEMFTAEDAQTLGVLAMTLQNTHSEIADLRSKRQDEAERVREMQKIDLSKVEQMRKCLQYLDARELSDSRTYEALINAARNNINECEQSIARSRRLIEDIEEEKRAKKGVFFNAAAHRRKELDSAADDIKAQQALLQELRTKIQSMEVKLDDLAHKCGLRNGQTLLKQIEEYNAQSSQVKDLDILDNVLSTRNASLTKTINELKPFFVKCGRDGQSITADSAFALSNDVARYIEEWRTLNSSFSSLKQSQQQLTFVQTELQDAEAMLESIFIRADVAEPANLEKSYTEFHEKLASYLRWEALTKDLTRLENDLRQDMPEEDLDLGRLEARRNDTYARMQDLVQKYPDIAEMTPPMGGSMEKLHVAADDELDGLRRTREEKLVHLRTVLSTFDETYMDTIVDLDQIEHDLKHVKQAQAAMELAKETLARLSGETYVHWATRLNAVAKEFNSVGLEYENLEFDANLELTVKRKGDTERLEAPQVVGQLSTGTKQQLNFLARMIVCRFLSGENPLPIVLDEVFCEFDDERFLRMMQFLIDVVAKNHQIIMFSCHQERYRTLLNRLTPEQRSLVEICKKTSLRG